MTGGWVIAKANVDYFQQIMFNCAKSFFGFAMVYLVLNTFQEESN